MLFFFFLIINLYFLIPAVIAQIPTMPTGASTNEANGEHETQPATKEKMS